MNEGKFRSTYQIRERIQFLAHQRAFLAPARNLAVHKVKEQAQGNKNHGEVQLGEIGGRAEAVPERRKDAHSAAEA